MENKRLIAATDLSDASDKSLQTAVMLAKKNNSEIILLHVFVVADIDESAKRMMGTNFLTRDIKRQLQETVDEIEKKDGVKATYLTKEGELFSLLAEASLETHSDILFVGTHGVHGVQHITGSFLAKTINPSPIPVWVVQKDSVLNPYKNIVVYIDEYPSEVLASKTLELARLFEAKLHFVFTEPDNAYTVSEMVVQLKTTLDREGMDYSLHFISEISDKPKAVLEMAHTLDSPIIIINRNGKPVDTYIPLLTNKHHLEVLCLN